MRNSSAQSLNTWKKFASQVRSHGCNLLNTLDDYPNSILVTGCQRSGTTVLARIIKSSIEVENKQYCKDDELSDALLLSGKIKVNNIGRYCFQTTYLNECINEYKKSSGDFKLIWAIRNPYSVVYSMAYHWGRFAFNELFSYVGYREMNWSEKKLYDRWGRHGLSKINKACMSYVAKNKQLLTLKDILAEDQLYIVDYDKLINNKHEQLGFLFEFLNLKYHTKYGEQLHTFSGEKHKKLDHKQRFIIQERCNGIYDKTIRLCNS